MGDAEHMLCVFLVLQQAFTITNITASCTLKFHIHLQGVAREHPMFATVSAGVPLSHMLYMIPHASSMHSCCNLASGCALMMCVPHASHVAMSVWY